MEKTSGCRTSNHNAFTPPFSTDLSAPCIIRARSGFWPENIRLDAFLRSDCFSQHKVFGPIEFQNNLGSKTPGCSKYLVRAAWTGVL